jgi:hypothetical protein
MPLDLKSQLSILGTWKMSHLDWKQKSARYASAHVLPVLRDGNSG